MVETFKQVHWRYASYWNVAHAGSGHVWQGRFYSCPLDAGHLWAALRYAELNPVRPGRAVGLADWPGSSAAAHCGRAEPQAWLEMVTWRQPGCEPGWQEFLGEGETESEPQAARNLALS